MLVSCSCNSKAWNGAVVSLCNTGENARVLVCLHNTSFTVQNGANHFARGQCASPVIRLHEAGSLNIAFFFSEYVQDKYVACFLKAFFKKNKACKCYILYPLDIMYITCNSLMVCHGVSGCN